MESETPEATLARRFRVQARSCRGLGSALYGDLMERAAEDVEGRGLLYSVLRGFETMPGPAALALRLFGAVHRLVLSGDAPDLGRFYPSAGGTEHAGSQGARAWPVFLSTVEANQRGCRAAVHHPPQTNEVGRSAALMPGYLRAHQATGLPLRILEVGASAGLNLHWDSFSYEIGVGTVIGDPQSPVCIPVHWYPEGLEALLGAPAVSIGNPVAPVASREACDRFPVDISTRDGALTLASYVWPDQMDRFARLLGAVEIARLSPVTVARADAGEWLGRRLRHYSPGTCTVVAHSVFLQYLSEQDRSSLIDLIREAGHRATREAPLAWLRMEPAARAGRPNLAEVRLNLWPGGTETVVADAGFHGQPVLPPS